jgi:hypothetical protein
MSEIRTSQNAELGDSSAGKEVGRWLKAFKSPSMFIEGDFLFIQSKK